jgi:RimJ/RimL family protein N-acetyltransferase
MLLRTDRLRLRPLDAGDLEPLAAMMRDPEVCRFIGDGRPRSRERVERTIRFAEVLWQGRGFGPFAIEREGEGDFLGVCLLLPIAYSGADPADLAARGPDIEIGYWLARDAWGVGYATEAARAVLRWAMSGAGLDRVIAVTHPSHERSQRVLERIGMRRIGETDAYYDATTTLYETIRSGDT